MGVITVEVDPEKLREDSVIFQGEGRPLNSYQHAVNDAALKLCLDDPSLVKQRGNLVPLAREQVHNEGISTRKRSLDLRHLEAQQANQQNPLLLRSLDCHRN